MADRIQLRRDTKANWEQYNPILLEGEPGHVLDYPNLYKMGDGLHAWNDLPYRGYNGNVTQEVQNDVDSVPSGAAIHSALKDSTKGYVDDEPTVGSDNLVKSGGVSLIAHDLDHRTSKILTLMSKDLVVARQVDVLGDATRDTCINADGTTASEEGYFVSAPFDVSNGEVVCVYGRCNRNKTIIAKYDGGTYKNLVGTVQSLSLDRYCYVAEDNMKIAICCALSDFRYCRIMKEDSEKALSSATKGETVIINNFDDFTHAYINFDGTTTNYNTYYITDTISIPAGTILQVKFKVNGIGIAEADGLTPLLWSHRGNEYSVNLYFKDATDIVLSGDVSQPLEYRIISSSDIDSAFSNTKGLRIKDSFDDFVEEYTFVDNLDRRNGYYLDWETAEPVANISYFISGAIPVHKGDKISINNLHESSGIAAIAYVDVVEGVTTYTPVVKSRTSSDTNLHYEYTFEKDGNCVISGHFDSLPNIEIKVYRAAYDKTAGVNYVSGYVGNILDKTVRKAINVEIEISDEYGNGAYLNKNYCEYVVYESYYISKPINVLKGDYISITGIRSSGTTVLAYYDEVDGNPVFTNILNGVTSTSNYSYVSKKDGQVVICGSKDSLGATTFTISRVVLEELATKAELEEVRDMIINHSSPKIINPYAGVDFDRSILSQSHEHCYDASKVANAYKRGIRVIACSHYLPAAPRYPLSSFSWEYQDYKSKEAVDNGDTETVTRTITDSIPTITVDGQTINTDTIPQIANAEHPFVKGQREHFNILGLLWAEPGHSLANGDTSTATWKREHALVTPQMLNGLLEDESKWQFGSQYAFGTINHTYDAAWIKSMLNACPNIFKAMEIFNQGYSKGWNDQFKYAYDSVLRDGKRIWCTSVVDWQSDWARWDYATQAEKDEWTEKFNALSEEEQAEYGTPENYYMETGRFKFDRGANRILLPSNYNSLSLQDKAKEVVKAYIGGRYYLVGLGNYSMQIIKDGPDITFMVSDLCPKIRVINGRMATEYTNVDSVTYNAKIGDKYVRFEAEWNDGDFVYSNPIWIE